MSTRYDELTEILGTGSAGTHSSTSAVDEQKQTSRRDELYSLLGESTAPVPPSAASGASTTQRDAILETPKQASHQSDAPSTSSGAYAPPSPQGEGRSAEQIQQEISDSRKRLAQLQSDAAYVLTAEPGAELGRQMDEERARIKALNEELDALKTPTTNAERDSLIQRMNAITENEGYATTVELADAVTQEKQDTRQRLHQLDEELGNAARFYDSGERAGAVVKGALKQTGSAYTNFMGTLQGLGNRLHESSSAADQAVAGSDYAGWATDELTAANMAEAIMKENPDGNYLEGLQKEEQRLYEKADAVAASAAKDIAQAKEGLSALGQAGVDVSVAIIQNGIDAVAKKSGLGMLPFFVRAAGGSMQEARHAGASTGQQLAYGLPKAAIEVATELLSGGIAGTGTSGLDDVVEPLINKLAKSTAGRIALNAIYDAAMEGTEEVVSDLLDPFVKLVYNDQALKEAWENRADVGAQMLYDYLIGAAVGSIGSGTQILTGAATEEVVTGKPVKDEAVTWQHADKNAALAGTETQAAEQAGTPTEQTPVKSYPTVEELIQPIRPAGNAEAGPVAPAAAGGNAPANAGVQATAQGQTAGQQVMTREERAQKEADWWTSREKEAEKAYEDAKKRYEESLNRGNADEFDFLSSPEIRKTLMDMAKQDLEDVRNRKIPSPFSNAEAQAAGTAAAEETTQSETPQSTPARPVMDTAENLTGIPGPVQRTGQGNNAPLQQNIDNGGTTAYNNTKTTNGGAENGIRTAGLQQDDAGRSAEADRGGIPGVYEGRDADDSGRGESGGLRVDTGFVLLSQQAQNTLRERGVAVVETRDVSNDKAAFSSALDSARAADTKNGWAVTPKSVEELEKSGARLLMDERGTAGLSVTPDGDIEAVFKSPDAVKGVTKTTIPLAIANGGTKLDCYGPGLVSLYAQYGFVPVARVKFDPEYANPGWDSSKGTPDIYFMMHNGDSADAVVDKMGTYPIPTKEELQALPEMDYDSAYAYRDKLLAERGSNTTAAPMEQSTQPATAGEQTADTTAQGQGTTAAQNAAPAAYNQTTGQREQPEGANAVRGFSKNVATDNAMEAALREDVAKNPDLYKRLSNKETLQKAQDIFTQGLDTARTELERAIGAAQSGQKFPPEMVPLSRMVANELTRQGELTAARKIISDVAAELTGAGELGQAGAILRNADPMTVLNTLQKAIDQINAEMAKKFGKRNQWTAELTAEEIKQISETDFSQDGAYEAIQQQIAERLGREMPATLAEKLREIRKVGMLANPKTQVKNFAGNVPLAGERKIAEKLSGGLQELAVKAGIMSKEEQTRTLRVSQQSKDIAKSIYKNNIDRITRKGNKGELRGVLRDTRTYFNKGIVQKALEKATGHQLNDAALDYVRRFTYDMLEKGDAPFVKSAFIDSLAQYCEAQGIKSEADVTETAISYAIDQAMAATFKDASALANLLNSIKDKAGIAGEALDVLFPFTTTPINIAKEFGKYSPLGYLQLLNAKGKSAAEVIDIVSRATTGSAVVAMGILLRSLGAITGAADDDKDKAAADKAAGISPYSILGKYSYEWMQPTGSALAMGASIYDAAKDGSSLIETLSNGIISAGDAYLEQSFYKDIIDLFKGYGSPTENMIKEVLTGTASQFIPTIVGATARTIDPTVRTSYTGGNIIDDILAQAKVKTPGLSKSAPASVNVRGEETKRGNLGERIWDNFIAPWSTNRNGKTANAVDNALDEVYEATGDKTIFRQVSPYKVDYGGESYQMTGKEREQFQKTQGQVHDDILQQIIDGTLWQKMDNDAKVKTMQFANEYALDAAKRELVESRGNEYSSDWDDEAELPDVGDYLAAKTTLKAAQDSKDYTLLDALVDTVTEQKKDVQEKLNKDFSMLDELIYGKQRGVDAETIYTAKAEADANGNGKISQEELWYYLGLQKNMPEETKDVLWDILTTGKTGYAQYAKKQK